tara:strand:- start:4667 stop:5371 length:705 start_codon:yes stop_codon:yes gene_type:complete
MKSLSFSLTHWLVLFIAVASVAYVTLYVSKVEAVYSRAVGTISVTQFVPSAGTSYEFVTLAFSGIIGQDSVANLEGWTLISDNGLSYDLSAVSLNNTDSVRICEEGVTDGACDYTWIGNDMFLDADGQLQLIARDGTPVIYIPYSEVATGQSLSDSGNYIDDVYTAGDKITICEMQKNGTLREKGLNVQRLTKDYDPAGADIVPPFVYERNKTLGYHPGINWPGGKSTFEAGCQ